MPLVISFIGWHNSGKTTLASQVVAHLKAKGYAVAVIKSTKETGLEGEQPWSDTATYRRMGADSVALVAPDQMIIRSGPPNDGLLPLALRSFVGADIVIAEGFKHADGVPKIEVRRDGESPLLRDQVDGVIAVATDLPLAGGTIFRLDQSREIAGFIEGLFLAQTGTVAVRITMTLDGVAHPLPDSVNKKLAATVRSLLAPLHPSLNRGMIDVSISGRQSSPETESEK